MVTQLLHSCGLYLGNDDDLMPPGPDNAAGFWENTKFVGINDEVLNALGGGWDCPPPPPDDWTMDARLQRLRRRASVLFRQFLGRGPWGWKDPRTSLTLPFWKGCCPNSREVVCLRNPLEVALSLHERNGVSYALGLNLWKAYNERILAATSCNDRVITHYDAYFADPVAELRRVLDAINLSVPDELIGQACSRVSLGLRHSRLTLEHLIQADVSSLRWIEMGMGK